MSQVKVNQKTAVLLPKSTRQLVLWLVCGLAVACLYSWVNLSGIVRFGLGWTIRPGFVVLFFIILLAVMELKKVAFLRILQIVFCLLAAIFLEYFSLPRPVDSFSAIALSLLGASILFNSARRIRISEVLLLLVSSYIQSVWLYNLFRGEQMMFFFKPGWAV